MYSVDPRRTSTAQWADAWLGARRRHRHRARQRHRPRDHPRRPGERGVRAQRHHGFRGLPRDRRAVHAGARAGDHRRPTRADPRSRARLRARRPCPDLLDAGHHRAPQRGRLRVRADQPRAAHRARRALRLRSGAAAWTEQRAGRRRHGRDPGQASRRLRPRRRRRPSPLRAGMGRADLAEARHAPLADVRCHERGHAARRCTASARTRPSPRRTPPTRGTCWRASTTWWCRTSSAPRRPSMADVVLPAAADWCEYEGTVTNSERRVQRVRKAIDPPGQACAGHPHHLRARRAPRPPLGKADRRAGVGRAALALAELAPRHVLRSGWTAPAGCSGPARTRITPVRRCCTPGCGRTTRPNAGGPRRSPR